MCLTVKTTLAGTATMIECGWKYFRGANRDQFPHSPWDQKSTCPTDKWITAVGSKIMGQGAEYDAGFHIFTDERKARNLFGSEIRRVYFRRPVARGVDQAIDAVVAKDMYVPAQEDSWPPQKAKGN